jgi:hypothetical protein
MTCAPRRSTAAARVDAGWTGLLGQEMAGRSAMRRAALLALCLHRHYSAAAVEPRDCDACRLLHVAPSTVVGGDGSGGDGSASAPFRSVHAAADSLATCARPAGCPPATVMLQSGVHLLDGRPLHLGTEAGGGAQRWVSAASDAVLSGGVLVAGWRPATDQPMSAGRLTHWTAPLPRGARPKTMRIGATRAPQVTFPSVDNTPAAAQYLFAREVNATSTPVADVVSFDTDSLPRGWESWTNLVAYTWPGSSWVGMRLHASPAPTDDSDSDSSGALARFIFESSTGVSNFRMGNRVKFAGAPELLGQPGTSGIWAVDEANQTVHLLSEAVREKTAPHFVHLFVL